MCYLVTFTGTVKLWVGSVRSVQHLSTCLPLCLFNFLTIGLSICIPIWLSKCQPNYLSIFLHILLSTFLLIYLSTCLPFNLRIFLPIRLTICLPIHLFIFLPICLSISVLSNCSHIRQSICPIIYLCQSKCLSIYQFTSHGYP